MYSGKLKQALKVGHSVTCGKPQQVERVRYVPVNGGEVMYSTELNGGMPSVEPES